MANSIIADNKEALTPEENSFQYPKIELDDYELRLFPQPALKATEECGENSNSVTAEEVEKEEKSEQNDHPSETPSNALVHKDALTYSGAGYQNRGKYFFNDSLHLEETGVWIPVSVPPMPDNEHGTWGSGLSMNGDYFPDGDLGWNQLIGEDKELTMWDVVTEMLLVAGGKVRALASGDFNRRQMSWISANLLDQAWKETAQTLNEVNLANVNEILESEPPRWLPDSAASACMLCNVRFHPLICSRHHCRFCGGLFCSECSKGRSLLPIKFRTGDPQRVCDVCCVRLESVQAYLMDQVGILSREKSIPDAILRQAKGLAILTVAKAGAVMTYKVGTGLVVARRKDGSWSAPSAICSFGMGWGPQEENSQTSSIVSRTTDAIKTFGGNAHFSFGAGISAAVGVVGRAVEADIRAGDGGYAACYTYSCSKGAFVGCSFEGNIVTTRANENSRFYGSPSLKAFDILLDSLPRPPAASILYNSLSIDLPQR